MTALLPWERLGGRVDERHLERLAVVYVRQSTRQQVLDHGESTRLQYGLVQRAVGLGWPASRVLVIDEDQGKSGASAAGRMGFQRLVTEITMGHVGLVLGIEMSRLARSGADWYQLLELCALSGALLADADGVYDPVDYNDRLLLGLKGTMSEAELHLLKQRMLAGKQAKARRGELAIGLPTGYVRRPSGEAALDPDEQVQTVVRLIFAKFAELGTLYAVLRWLVDHDVELGMRLQRWPGQGGADLAAAEPDDPAEHPAQPGLCGDLRLRPPPGRPSPAAGGPAQHRPGRAGRRRVAGGDPGAAARLHHRRAVSGQPGPAGRQRRPRRDPRGGAGGVGAAVGAGALRALRSAHDGALPPPRSDHGPRVCLRQAADRLRCGPALPGPGRGLRRRAGHPAGPGRPDPGRGRGLAARRRASPSRAGRTRQALGAAPGARPARR